MSKQINIQGHRGARGLFPENTLTGFIEAIKLGVHTLELDVVISADQQLVVSHEAWMNEDFCCVPNGARVESGTGKNYNLFRMTYAEIKKFDCGKNGNPHFPTQKAMPAYKPLLSEVIATIEAYARDNELMPPGYNIELKTEEDDERYNPPPAKFADLVYREIQKIAKDIRFNIQSFDVRLLREMRSKDPAIQIGLLVENEDGLASNLERLGFKPEIYSPDFRLVDDELVEAVHGRGMKLIPWTVNEQKDMMKLIAMDVNGIITDYPDRLIELMKNL